MPQSPQDAILVGPARSGTTLACELLNKVSDVVALDEPFDRDRLRCIDDPGAFLALVAGQFRLQRAMIERHGEAESTLSEGGVLANHYATPSRSATLRKRQVTLDRMRDVSAPRNFKLVIKHTLPFTALFDDLFARYETFVIVRNPLAILASWNSIDAAYRQGSVQPYVQPLLKGDLAKRLEAIGDRLDRQIALLEWHFERYRPALRAARVVRYEDVVATGGRALELISPSCRQLELDLESHNTNPLYDRDAVFELKERLFNRRGCAFWDFYTPADADRLLDELVSC